MDYYKVLGLHKSATKSEIKQAFRKLAVIYHPDKHTSSNKSVKDNAIHKFKQISEAYEVLSNDRKRADYNLRSSGHGAAGSGFSSGHSSYYKGYGYGYGYGYQSRRTNYEYKYYYSDYGKAGGGFASRLEITLNYLTSRSFLFNAILAGTIIGGAVIIDKGRGVLWKLNNSGKSFEDAMDSIEKAKAVKDDKK